ncbi:Hypothetical protein GbCGDNIH7_0417 [Granulibacter bethesdensis]|nr:Hypothetical protein GbCGDNIH7_0417 [Granulibacter bethesdensis]
MRLIPPESGATEGRYGKERHIVAALIFGVFYLAAIIMIVASHGFATSRYQREMRRWGDEEAAFFGCFTRLASDTVSGWLLDRRVDRSQGPIVVSAHRHGRMIGLTTLAMPQDGDSPLDFTLTLEKPVTESDLLSERVVLWARDGHLVRQVVMDAVLQRRLIGNIH